MKFLFFIFLVPFLAGCASKGVHVVYQPGYNPSQGYSKKTNPDPWGDGRSLLYIGLEKSTNYGNCSVKVVETKRGWRYNDGRWGNHRLSSRINGLKIGRNKYNSKQAQVLMWPGTHDLVLEIHNHQTREKKTVRESISVPSSTRNVYRTVQIYTGSFCQSDRHYRDDCYYYDNCHHRYDNGHHKKKKKHKNKKKKRKKEYRRREAEAKKRLQEDMKRRGMKIPRWKISYWA